MMFSTCLFSFTNVISSFSLCMPSSFLLFLLPFLIYCYTINKHHYSLFSSLDPVYHIHWVHLFHLALSRSLQEQFKEEGYNGILSTEIDFLKRCMWEYFQTFYPRLSEVNHKQIQKGNPLPPTSSWSELPLASIIIVSVNHGHVWLHTGSECSVRQVTGAFISITLQPSS